MISAARFNEHTALYRDIWAIVELKNVLVHYKPTWDPDSKRKIDLVSILKRKYKLSPFSDSDGDFITMRSMSSGCTDWVVRSALAFLREFDARSHLDEKKFVGLWKLES